MARLIDPVVARAVARRFSGDRALTDSYLMERLERDLAETVPQSESLVARASGIPAPPPVQWGLVDRSAWAEANIAGMSSLLQPLAERIERRLDRAPVGARLVQRGLVSVEVGALLGYVSRRVLGQYDILVPEAEQLTDSNGSARLAGGPPLYFVGPNIVETERRFSFVPREFALWVSLHEVTHRFQFAGVPWLKPRFFRLVGSYLESADIDARKLAGRLRVAVERLMSQSLPAEERHPIYLLATPEQRRLLDDIQALMAVVEGHGNYVMDSVGAEVIPSFARMRRIFDRRREQTGALQRAVNHAIGLELKLRQYELGQGFCEAVVATGGSEALARVWAEERSFPSISELRQPSLWLDRVA